MFNPWGIKWFIAYLFILGIQYCNMFERNDLALCFCRRISGFSDLSTIRTTIEEKLHKGWTDQIIKKLEDEMNKKVKK